MSCPYCSGTGCCRYVRETSGHCYIPVRDSADHRDAEPCRECPAFDELERAAQAEEDRDELIESIAALVSAALRLGPMVLADEDGAAVAMKGAA